MQSVNGRKNFMMIIDYEELEKGKDILEILELYYSFSFICFIYLKYDYICRIKHKLSKH